MRKEESAAYHKKYHLEHKEKINECSKAYRNEHKAELTKKSKLSREAKMQLLQQLRELSMKYPYILSEEETNSLRTKDTCGGIKRLSSLLSKFQSELKEVSIV
jgi:hypothetical protein